MDAKPKTSLSAGEIIRAALITSKTVTDITDKIFPIVVDEAKLPYVVYRRSGLDRNPTKSGLPVEQVLIDIYCYAKEYTESIELAEAVRSALDGLQFTTADLRLRSCTLTDSEEAFQDDAFLQSLTFTLKI